MKKTKPKITSLSQEMLANILKNLDLPTIKKLMYMDYLIKDQIYSNYILWHMLSKSKTPSVQKCINDVKSNYILRRNIMRGQNEEIVTFNTGQRDITYMEISDNKIICSSDDSSIKMFSAHGKEEMNFKGHKAGVWTFTCNEKYLISGSIDRTGRIWDIKRGYTLCMLVSHTSTIRTLKVCDGLICTGSRDATIRVWNMEGEHLFLLSGHTQSVRCMDINDKSLVSGSYDGSVMLWDYKKGNLRTRLPNHSSRVYCVSLGKTLVASGGLDGYINVSHTTGNLYVSYKHHTFVVAKLSFSSCQKYLLSSGGDRLFCKYDIVNKTLVYRIEENSIILSHELFNDLLILATDKEVKLYDFCKGSFIRKLMDAQKINKIRVQGKSIVVGFYSNGATQVRIFKY